MKDKPKATIQVYRGKAFGGFSPMDNSEDCLILATKVIGKESKLRSFRNQEELQLAIKNFEENYECN